MRFSILGVVFLLSGCAGLSYALEHYSDVPVQEVRMADDNYRVFDKPQEGRMMITSSIGSAMGQGAVKGLALGIAETTPPQLLFQRAAEKFLSDSGRRCRITGGHLVIQPQYEFRYTCEATR